MLYGPGRWEQRAIEATAPPTPAHQLLASESAEDVGLFVLPLAPDRLHKGQRRRRGPPYSIVVPDGCADGMFAAELTMPFVCDIHWVFSEGGFPGFRVDRGYRHGRRLTYVLVTPVMYSYVVWR